MGKHYCKQWSHLLIFVSANESQTRLIIYMYKDSEVRGLAVTLSVKDGRMSTLSCKNKIISFEVRFSFIWVLVLLVDKMIKSRDLQTNLLSRAESRDSH